jgi:hypothetical protein
MLFRTLYKIEINSTTVTFRISLSAFPVRWSDSRPGYRRKLTPKDFLLLYYSIVKDHSRNRNPEARITSAFGKDLSFCRTVPVLNYFSQKPFAQRLVSVI